MNFVKNHWQKYDILDFKEFEKTLIGSEKDCLWEQRIVNTKLTCFGRTNTKAKMFFNQIKKGNYFEFLDLLNIENHFESILSSYLICSIKDFEIFEKYLDKFVLTIDNWASADTLKFKNKDITKLTSLSKKYMENPHPFIRRVGVNIYFDLIKNEECFADAVQLLDSLQKEEDYYVNMSAAWLLSYMFVINREKTLSYFKNNETNKFIINKGISKCRDSFRVSKEDKDLLLKFKK